MVDEVIKEIRLAEEKADQMQKDAYQQGKDIVLQSEIDAEKMKKDTILECKQMQRDAIDAANAKALNERAQIMKKGDAAADKLIDDNNAAIEETADNIVKLLIEKYTA